MNSRMTYQAIVFDFGNVLLDLDIEKSFGNFSELLGFKLSMDNFPKDLLTAFRNLETGKINVEEWIWAFQQIKSEIQPRQVLDAWNSLLIGLPAHRIPFLVELRKKYKIFLLSNINQVHEDWIDRYLKKEYEIEDFKKDYFDGYFYSHHIGMRKPNADIYSHVKQSLHNQGISEFFFIDDMKKNVEGAAENGWKAIVHDPKTDIAEELERYLQHTL